MSKFVYILSKKRDNDEIPKVVKVYGSKPSYKDLFEEIVKDEEVTNEHLKAIYEIRDYVLPTYSREPGPIDSIPVKMKDLTYYIDVEILKENN